MSNVLTNVYKIIKFKIGFTITNFIIFITLQENIVSDIYIYNYYTKGAVSYKILLPTFVSLAVPNINFKKFTQPN